MGEMADYYRDSLFDEDEYGISGMDNVMTEDGEHFEGPYMHKGVTCRCCKTPGLHWGRFSEKWRLFDDKGIHNCPVNPLLGVNEREPNFFKGD